MKLLVATTDTQGQRDNDFCFVPEGELVGWNSLVCGKDTDPQTGVPDPEGPCGCGRSFAGLMSGNGTTTARVIEVPALHETWTAAIPAAVLTTLGNEALGALAGWPEGTIVERRGDILQARG